MNEKTKKVLIINSPYEEPTQHWRQSTEGKDLVPEKGRRKAGYMIVDPRAKPHQDHGRFIELPLANKIRARVAEWRRADYPNITGITQHLLRHWFDNEQRSYPFFFCQLEAIETLIWLLEVPEAEKTGIDIPTDGGAFCRLCCKLATGAGKTVVMAMLIAWQVLNKASHPQDKRFSKNILIIAPGLTVKRRLAVLRPSADPNYYDEFNIVPPAMRDTLRQGKITIRNWHALSWESDEKIKKKKTVDKRGAKSDEAYTREVLGELANARNMVVINDEAHHAWRVNSETRKKYSRQRDIKDSAEEATVWLGGLDRLHKTRGILNCFDFSATPFVPLGHQADKEDLFGWIVSDFGLNDAIESGLVKTPRTVIRDDSPPDAKTYKSRLYHIYNDPDVNDDLNRSALPKEPLPELVTNAYYLLGHDWQKTKIKWQESGHKTPPVMITVANRTETAARVRHTLQKKGIPIDELCQSEGILHIDSKVLKEAEDREQDIGEAHTARGKGAGRSNPSKEERAKQLREMVNTVGQEGKPGAGIHNVISVGMLSEGWDARTVTHIMGLRAFSSQLLCEQVIGRGLRRASYEINEETQRFDPEYVNVFGVPFAFLPHENEDEDNPPRSAEPKILVTPVAEKEEFAISWPNVVRIERVYRPQLSLDWDKVKILELDAATIIEIAELAPTTADGTTNIEDIKDIDIKQLAGQLRAQEIIFKTARDLWEQMKMPTWKASPAVLMAQLVGLAEQFMDSKLIKITPASYDRDERRRRLVIVLSMAKVVRHIRDALEFSNIDGKTPCFDRDHPIGSTGAMRPWRTGRPCHSTRHSHINVCVFDGTWEASAAFELDRNPNVAAWVKNDHLDFDIPYVYNGKVRKYRPDFLVRLKSGDMLIIEVKGQQTDTDNAKQKYTQEWIEAMNQHGGFGHWRFDIARAPADIVDIIEQHAGEENPPAAARAPAAADRHPAPRQ